MGRAMARLLLALVLATQAGAQPAQAAPSSGAAAAAGAERTRVARLHAVLSPQSRLVPGLLPPQVRAPAAWGPARWAPGAPAAAGARAAASYLPLQPDALASVFTETGLAAVRAAGAAAAAAAPADAGQRQPQRARGLQPRDAPARAALAWHWPDWHWPDWPWHPKNGSGPSPAPAPAPPPAPAPVPPPQPRPPTPPHSDTPFEPAKAGLLAALQAIAYCGDTPNVRAWNCTRCARVPGFSVHFTHFDAEWDLSGYAGYLPSLGAKVLVFRGTDSSSWSNWVNNMRAWRTDATYPVPGAPRGLRIHSGFETLWNASSMAATFLAGYARLAAAHPRGPTYVIGHSMGGALAHLAALDIRSRFEGADLHVFTFGAPRVGNAVFAAFFEASVTEAWRFTHNRDIVPSLPPLLMGFHHTSREVWLVDVAGLREGESGGHAGDADAEGAMRVAAGAAAPGGGRASSAARRLQAGSVAERGRHSLRGGAALGAVLPGAAAPIGGGLAGPPPGRAPAERIIVCDESGEDPSCHNSACTLGLCTSIADHLLYMDSHMWAGDEC